MVAPIVFVTGNDKKWNEISSILATSGIKLERIDIEIIAIAREKCRRAAVELGGNRPVIVEDTSLCFEAFGGNLPGAYIKWFIKDLGPTGVIKMLAGFSDRRARALCTFAFYPAASEGALQDEHVNGKEKCASSAVQGMVEVVGGDHDGCFVNKRAVHVPTDDEILIFQGITEGFIVEEPRQHSTRPVFAWDPIFQPVEQECAVPQTFAEMDPNFKNKISHRRKGLDLLLAHFTNLQK